jgi:hypothetical protein
MLPKTVYVAANASVDPVARPKSCWLSARLLTAEPPRSTSMPFLSFWICGLKY